MSESNLLSDEWIQKLQATKSEAEWNAICDQVKIKYGGYPKDWFAKVVMSGLARRMEKSWLNHVAEK